MSAPAPSAKRTKLSYILVEAYRTLVSQKPDFKAYLLGGPKVDDFSIERESDTGRDVEL